MGYKPNTLYEILKAVYDDNGSLNTYTPSTAQEFLKAVYEDDGTGKGRLRIDGGGGSDTLSGLTDVTLVSLTNGQLLGYNGSYWTNVDPGAASAFPLKDLTDTTITNIQIGQIIQWNGSAWVNVDIPQTDLSNYYTKNETDNNFLSANTSLVDELNDLNDVTISNPADNDMIIYDNSVSKFINTGIKIDYLSDVDSDGATENQLLIYNDITDKWEHKDNPSYTKSQSDNNFLSANTTLVDELNDLSDVSLTSETNGEALVYNGTGWVNSAITADLSNYYTKNETDNNFLSANTSLVSDLPDLGDVSISNPLNDQVLKYNGTEWVNASSPAGATDLDGLTDVTLTSETNGESLVYNGSVWVNSAITADLSNYYTRTETDNNFLSANTTLVDELNDLSDVVLTAPSVNEALIYNGVGWVNSAITSGGATDLDGLTDVTISNPTDNQILKYNSGTTQWENVDSTIIDVTNPQSGETLVYNNNVWVNSAITSGHDVENGLTIVNDKIHFGGSLSADTTLNISGHEFKIQGLSATTTYDDDSILSVITDDGTTITGTTDIESMGMGVQDTSNYNLSYIDINLSSGVTISSNNSGQTSSGNTNYIIVDSDSVEIGSDTGSGTKILMTATDGSTQYYLTVDSSGNLVTQLKS